MAYSIYLLRNFAFSLEKISMIYTYMCTYTTLWHTLVNMHQFTNVFLEQNAKYINKGKIPE